MGDVLTRSAPETGAPRGEEDAWQPSGCSRSRLTQTDDGGAQQLEQRSRALERQRRPSHHDRQRRVAGTLGSPAGASSMSMPRSASVRSIRRTDPDEVDPTFEEEFAEFRARWPRFYKQDTPDPT